MSGRERSPRAPARLRTSETPVRRRPHRRWHLEAGSPPRCQLSHRLRAPARPRRCASQRPAQTAMSEAPVATSRRVSLPVPAARSNTRLPGASPRCSASQDTASGDSSGDHARRRSPRERNPQPPRARHSERRPSRLRALGDVNDLEATSLDSIEHVEIISGDAGRRRS